MSAFPLRANELTGDDSFNHIASVLGLEVADLTEPLRVGAMLAAEGDPLHLSGFAGTQMYHWTGRRLRGVLQLKGWEPTEEGQVQYVQDPTGEHRIAVVAGNVATGRPGEDARSLRPRGRNGREQARQPIRGQLRFDIAQPPGEALAKPVTYVLLHHLNLARGLVQSELSIPATTDHGGVIADWHLRVLLPDVDFGGGPGRKVTAPPSAPSPPVEVRRRRSA